MDDLAQLSARCPGCGQELWGKRGGQFTLRNRIVKVLDDGTVAAKCPEQGCNHEVPIPFLVVQPPPRPRRPAPRLVLRG